MAKEQSTGLNRQRVIKRTSQGGQRPKTSAMNKDSKRSYKKYRGQGK